MINLSAIFLIDEFIQNDYIPWKESLVSILKFCDEVIVVHGGKNKPPDASEATYKYINSLHNPKIKLYIFKWKESDGWFQMVRSLNYGYLKSSGDWYFRVLCDEVFPYNMFKNIKIRLTKLPLKYDVVSVGRFYLLGSQHVYRYRDKPLFIRRNSDFGYGIVHYKQGTENTYRTPDDPSDITKYFNGNKKITLSKPILVEKKDAINRLKKGDIPKGFRDSNDRRIYKTNRYFINTDVNYYPNKYIIKQKRNSYKLYNKLPKEYRKNLESNDLSDEKILENLKQKIRRMIYSKKLIEFNIPDNLLKFIKKHNDIKNVVRQECLKAELPWDEKVNMLKRIKLYFRNKAF